LLVVCRSLEDQTFRDFEVCISDDCSTDGRAREITAFLEASTLSFAYRRAERNRRYDGNLRAALDLAMGRYCFLLGNDDAMKGRETLHGLHAAMERLPPVAVALTNSEEFDTGQVTRRVSRTSVVGSGARLAAARFRQFSFVSGVVLDRAAAAAQATDRWDGSEMYQMFIGCRLIAAGGALADIDLVTVRKNVRVPGEGVESYATKAHQVGPGLPAQAIPLTDTARLVVDAIAPCQTSARRRAILSVVLQYYGVLLPFWLLEYRRVQSWRFAAGVCRAMRPSATLDRARVPPPARLAAWLVYASASAFGLLAPTQVVGWVRRPVTTLARRFSDWSAAPSRP
jgi:glycosyltransferase involved in cell wall biosynthesis